MSTDTAERTTTKSYTGPAEVKDADQGTFSAVFSTFDVIDADGDVVRKGAIPDGVEVPIVWGHDWGMMPIGKGTISTNKKNAVIDGRFNLATDAGRAAWETLKFMGSAQQYSWGFEITEHSFGEFEGRQVRFITGTKPHEVSPVLVGSNPVTGTLSVKGPCPLCGHKAEPEGDLKAEPEEPSVEVDGWEDRARIKVARARMETASGSRA